MLEVENNKHLRTITGGPLKNKEMLRDENDKHVQTSTRKLFKKKRGNNNDCGQWITLGTL